MEYLWAFIRSLLAIVALLGAFAYMTWVERRLLARFQIRVGPSRVGIMGLLQPIADAVKMVFKEQITVHNADRLVYVIAPIVSVTFALLTFGIIPFGPKGSFFGLNPWVLNLDIGVLYILAIGELAVYGIFLAGWASGSKYSLMGSMRSAAGLISYDLALGLALLGPVVLVGSLNINDIVAWQALHPVGLWLYQFPALVVFAIASLAEAARTPFDLPEAEQELVGGYHTEYSGMRFAVFQMAEYLHMITAAAVIPTLFFSGWHAPFGLPEIPYLWLIIKMAIFLFIFIWIRASWFRLRYDQLMRFAWGWLVPAGVVWFLITAAVVARGGLI